MKFTVFLITSIMFLFFGVASASAADIVINEFSARSDPDWVEIYNTGADTKSLEGWVIRDSTESNMIHLDRSICAGNSRVFDFSNRLNNAGDTIRLLDSEGSSSPQDSITYFSGTIPEHQADQSTSRLPDGSSTWILLESPTPNDDTSCDPQPNPPPPNPSPSPSPTPTPTPVPSPTPTPIKSPSPSPKPTPKSSPSPSSQTPSILGETSDANSSPNPSPSPEAASGSLSKTKAAAIITGAGALLIALSFGFYLWYSKLLGNEKSPKGVDFEEVPQDANN